MKKIKISVGVIGFLPFEFDRNLIKNWKSKVFEIVDEIEDYHFTKDSDLDDWGYSDELLSSELPVKYNGDFFIGITYVPVEKNYYCRRLEYNRMVLSYFEMIQILRENNIKIENLFLRAVYSACLVYLRNQQHLPKSTEWVGYTHDDPRGCLFDMNPNKIDVIFSLDKPIICDECINNIRSEKISDNLIDLIKEEIKKIKRGAFYKIQSFIIKKPILSIIISSIFGIFLSFSASVLYGVLIDNKDVINNNYYLYSDSTKVKILDSELVHTLDSLIAQIKK